VCGITLLLALTCSAPTIAEVLEVPVDPRDRMSELDDALVAKRRELFGARQRNDTAAIEKLTKEFDDIQHQRNEILKRDPRLD
jgi:uncharacterized membrane protein (DUF106 family)